MNIIFLPQAQKELAEVIDFYEQQLNRLGSLFSKELFETIDLICLYPEGWQLITKHTRKCPLRKFPYLILYGIIDGVIVISSIAHQHRHPDSYLRN